MVWSKTANTKRNPKSGRLVSMWTKTKLKKLHSLYVVKGLTIRKTATVLECSHAAVQQALEARNWVRRKPKKSLLTDSFLDIHYELIMRLYETNSAASLAKKLRISLSTLISFLKDEGVFRHSAKDRILVTVSSGKWVWKTRKGTVQRLLSVPNEGMHPLEYKQALGRLTEYMVRDWGALIDPAGKRSYKWHIDHIFSQKAATHKMVEGKWVPRRMFVPLKYVAHPANLKLLSRSENASKANHTRPINWDCKALLARVKAFERTYGNPYRKYL